MARTPCSPTGRRPRCGAIHGGGGAKIDVTLPSRSARAWGGIEVHTSLTLNDADKASYDGIPCTRPARTLVDLGHVANRRAVQRAVDQAEVLRLFDLRAVEDALGRAGRRRGVGILGAVLGDYTGPALTSHELEERFLGFCRAASLPEPEVNAWISLNDGVAYKADFPVAAGAASGRDGRLRVP